MTKKKTKKKAAPTVVRSLTPGEGVTYQLRLINCGNASCRKGCNEGRNVHGPYWYRLTHNPVTKNKSTKYLGKQEPTIEDITRDLHATEEAS